jgi:hypothetical protein
VTANRVKTEESGKKFISFFDLRTQHLLNNNAQEKNSVIKKSEGMFLGSVFRPVNFCKYKTVRLNLRFANISLPYRSLTHIEGGKI